MQNAERSNRIFIHGQLYCCPQHIDSKYLQRSSRTGKKQIVRHTKRKPNAVISANQEVHLRRPKVSAKVQRKRALECADSHQQTKKFAKKQAEEANAVRLVVRENGEQEETIKELKETVKEQKEEMV